MDVAKQYHAVLMQYQIRLLRGLEAARPSKTTRTKSSRVGSTAHHSREGSMTAPRSRSSLRRAVRRTFASLPRSLRRGFVASSLVAVSLPALATPARGQGTGDPLSSPDGGFELRPYVGAYLPTGDQRDFLEDAVLTGAQASWRINPVFAITGTFGWSPSADRLTLGEPTLDLFQYDIGAEARAAGWLRRSSWTFSPFVGLGLGGRTYHYRDLDVDSSTQFGGYGALGGDFGLGRFGLRLEARDYVSRFEPLIGADESDTRNDVAVLAGLNYRF